MKNAMQLKAVVRNMSKEKKISAQLVLQNYMLERFLERVSLSAYRDYFIIKGGFLIASMVGLDSRATMDMERFVRGISPAARRAAVSALRSPKISPFCRAERLTSCWTETYLRLSLSSCRQTDRTGRRRQPDS